MTWSDIGDIPHEGELRCNEPMAQHTAWRIGGMADYYYQAANPQDLSNFLQRLPPGVPRIGFGRGSNVLVRDGGLRGVVLAFGRGLAGLSRLSDRIVQAQAGAHCASVARFAATQGLGGAEFLAGIPGSVGGGLAMNAGAWGRTIWDLVHEVSLVDDTGHFSTHRANEFEAVYRDLKGIQGRWFFSCTLHMTHKDRKQCQEEMRRLLVQRARTQPLRYRSCGSVFKNPPGDHAARLIETCGLKGSRIGAARVSERHGNFIINDGGATAADIERLIGYVKTRVQKTCGVILETEVRIIGDTEPPSMEHRQI